MWFSSKKKEVIWNTNPPNKEGYYWVMMTNGDYDFKHIVYVQHEGCDPDVFTVHWFMEDEEYSFSDMEDYYWGPEIKAPE